MVKKILFTIDKEGEVSVTVEGTTGEQCVELTDPFEKILGEVNCKTFKDSYYQQGHYEDAREVETPVSESHP